MKVSFISLGCPKNTVNSEQMLYLVQQAGHEIVPAPEEAELTPFFGDDEIIELWEVA